MGSSSGRRFSRVAVELECTIVGATSEPVVARRVNVGFGGLLLRSERDLPLRCVVDLRVQADEDPIEVGARILRKERDHLFAVALYGNDRAVRRTWARFVQELIGNNQ